MPLLPLPPLHQKRTSTTAALAIGHHRAQQRGGPSSGCSTREDENDTAAAARLEDKLAFRPKTNTRSSLQPYGKKQRSSGERRIEVRD